MYLRANTLPHPLSKYTALVESLKEEDYTKIIYELDCEPEIPDYSVITYTSNSYEDTIGTYYPHCTLEDSYEGVFNKNITKKHFIDSNIKISQWGKVQVICERIQGTLKGFTFKDSEFRILVSVPSLKTALAELQIEDSTAILEEVRDCLERPYITLWLTIPAKGYNVTELGVECRWSKTDSYSILRNLYSLDLISKGVYHHVYYQPTPRLKLEYYKIVFQHGKITQSKLYFSPKKNK